MSDPAKGPFWREPLAPYAQPRLARSLLDVATSVVPYLALSVLMYMTLGVSDLLTIALPVIAMVVGPRLPAAERDRACATACSRPTLRWSRSSAGFAG